MRKVITIIILMLTVRGYGADVVLGKVSDLTWQGSGTAWYSAFGSVATPVYTNSLHEINTSAWSNSIEYLFDDNSLSWTNHTSTNDTGGVTGTYHMTNVVGAVLSAVTNAGYTNQYYVFRTDDYLKRSCPTELINCTNMVLSFWVKTINGSRGDFVTVWTTGGAGAKFNFLQGVTANRFSMYWRTWDGATPNINAPNNLTTNAWTHLAFNLRHSGGDLSWSGQLWTNGYMCATSSASRSYLRVTDVADPLIIGSYNGGGYCNADIDDVKIIVINDNGATNTDYIVTNIYQTTKYRFGL